MEKSNKLFFGACPNKIAKHFGRGLLLVILFGLGSTKALSAYDTRALSPLQTLEKLKNELDFLSVKVGFKNIIVDLKFGSKGSDIEVLQRFLKSEEGIYPEGLVTGYFGRATEKAVKKFQKENSIKSTGVVGPLTRARINKTIETVENIAKLTPLDYMAPNSLVQKISPQEPKTISVHFSVAPKPNYDLQALGTKILEMINKIRVENGLGTTLPDAQIAKVALEHSYNQEKDNIQLTNPLHLCHYLLIRHEGFSVDGFSLGDRYAFNNIDYKMGGENIAMVPSATDVYYTRSVEEPDVPCPDVPKFPHESGVPATKIALYNDVLQKSLIAVSGERPATIINKSWNTVDQIASTTVNGWMNSPGHRDNILRPEYNFSGIGIVNVNDYMIITHNFVYR